MLCIDSASRSVLNMYKHIFKMFIFIVVFAWITLLLEKRRRSLSAAQRDSCSRLFLYHLPHVGSAQSNDFTTLLQQSYKPSIKYQR